MMKEPKLWRRGDRGWYVTLGRKQVAVGKDEAGARKEYHRILASEGFVKPDGQMKVSELLDIFCRNSEKNNKPRTAEWHRFFLDAFAARYGKLQVREVKRLHVTNWTQEPRKRPWGQNTVRHAMSCLRAAFRFGVSEGYIREEPIKLKLPAQVRRDGTLSAADIALLYEHAGKGGFADVLTGLLESGCRPSELCSIEARHVDLDAGVWRLPEHKTKAKTGRSRAIYLSARLLEISRRLAGEHPEGPIFRNAWGRPWSPDNIRLRFKRLKQRHGLDERAVPYMARSSFITGALENGVPIATVAELAGHTDVRMINQHYSFLSHRVRHLRDAVEQATKKP